MAELLTDNHERRIKALEEEVEKLREDLNFLQGKHDEKEAEIEYLHGLIDRISEVAHDGKKFPVNAIAEIWELIGGDYG